MLSFVFSLPLALLQDPPFLSQKQNYTNWYERKPSVERFVWRDIIFCFQRWIDNGEENLCTWILCVKNLQQVSISVCELTRAFRSFLSNTRWPSIAEFRFFPSTCTFTGSPISQLPAGRCMINICCNKIIISSCFSSILWSGFIYLKCRLKLQEFGLCQVSFDDLTWKAFSCFTTFFCSLWTFAVSSDKLLCSWRPLIAVVAKLPPTLDFRSGMDIICGYASEHPANSTQSLNNILSNQSQNADTNNTLCSLDLWIQKKMHAPTTTINCSLRLKRWTRGETTCEATI